MRPIDAALKYAQAGWYVFPIEGKVPKTTHGHLDATTDVTKIAEWWTTWPDAGIGVHCRASGFIAFDIDPRNGGDQDLVDLEGIWGPLPRDAVQRSKSGGQHILTKDPSPGPAGWTRPQAEGGETRGKVTPGIDVKNNGFIVVEPTSGYQWETLDLPLPKMPANWQALIRKDEEELDAGGSIEAWVTTVRRLNEDEQRALVQQLAVLQRGQGESSTMKAITRIFHGFGQSIKDGWPFLENWNKYCGQPHTHGELRRQVLRVAERPLYRERGWVLKARDVEDAVGEVLEDLAEDIDDPRPTETRLRTLLRAEAVKRGGNEDQKVERAYLKKVLEGKELSDVELVDAVRALRRHAPAGTTDEQLSDLLTASAVTAERADAVVAAVEREATPAVDDVYEEAVDDNDHPFVRDENGNPTACQQNVDSALGRLGVRLRYDEFAQETLVTIPPGDESRLEDAQANRLWFEIDARWAFRMPWDAFNRQLDDRARQHPFNPVADYLDSLEWDGVERLDTWLSNYAGAKDTPYCRAVSRIVLVAAVRRARTPGVKFDEMLVLEGHQGTNKSTALKLLARREKWFGDDLPLGADTRRQMEAIAGHWIIEAGELKGMRKAEVQDLKGFLSRTSDKARLAYGRRTQMVDRRCIFIGTTNDAQYLRDPTGDRRFWPVEIRAFDLGALRRDVDQLWAEAARAEALGESIRLDPELWDLAAAEQERRRMDDPVEERLDELLQDKVGIISSDDLWKALEIEPARATQDQIKRRGEALRRLGWTRARRRRPNEMFGGAPRIYGYTNDPERGCRWLTIRRDSRNGAVSWRVIQLVEGVVLDEDGFPVGGGEEE